MYINGLFLLLFWCLGWAGFGFANSLYLILLLLLGLLVDYSRIRCALGLIIFLLASAGQYHQVHSQFPSLWAGKDLHIRACVTKLNASPRGLSLWLTKAQIHKPIVQDTKASKPIYLGLPSKLTGQVKVSIYGYSDAAQPQLNNDKKDLGLAALIGHEVELIVRLKGARNYQNPQHFDYLLWSQLEGQAASGYVKEWIATKEVCSGLNAPKLGLEKLRQRLWQGLQHYGETHLMAPIAVGLWGALTLGQTSGLSASQWQVLAATGTTHLLVISGLHVGLVAVLAMLLTRLLLMPISIQSSLGLRVCAWVGLLAGLGFALLSGFGLPAQRAVIMLAGLMWGAMWGLQLSFSQRLFIAFFMTLLVQPLSASSLGFWLSYTAVFALGLVWYKSHRQYLWQRVLQLLAAQAALSLLLLPVIALSTGYVSLVGPLVNIVLVPMFSMLLIPSLLLVSIGSLFIPLAGSFFTSVNFILLSLWQGLEGLARLPWSQVFVGWLPLEGFVSLLVVACLCLMTRRWHWPLLSLLLPLVFFITVEVFDLAQDSQYPPSIAVSLPKHQLNTQSPVIITVLDVGQGLSLWIRQGKNNMLYDVGNYFQSGFNLVDAVILPELEAQGINQLELVLISHWDRDHSGGLNRLLQQQQVKRLILPSERKAKPEKNIVKAGVNVSRCASSAWQNLWQDTTQRLMWRQIALAEYGLSGNNASCVILLNIYGRQLLITGDIEARAETLLIDIAANSSDFSLSSEVLIAPHHGSKTSSTEAFLATVRPAYVLVSAGKNNAYGHPHKQVTQAYWKYGSHWFNTGRQGQIRLVFNANGSYQVRPYLP